MATVPHLDRQNYRHPGSFAVYIFCESIQTHLAKSGSVPPKWTSQKEGPKKLPIPTHPQHQSWIQNQLPCHCQLISPKRQSLPAGPWVSYMLAEGAGCSYSIWACVRPNFHYFYLLCAILPCTERMIFVIRAWLALFDSPPLKAAVNTKGVILLILTVFFVPFQNYN